MYLILRGLKVLNFALTIHLACAKDGNRPLQGETRCSRGRTKRAVDSLPPEGERPKNKHKDEKITIVVGIAGDRCNEL